MISSIDGIPYQIGTIIAWLHSGHIITIFYHIIMRYNEKVIPLTWICAECYFEIQGDQVDDILAKINFHSSNNYH